MPRILGVGHLAVELKVDTSFWGLIAPLACDVYLSIKKSGRVVEVAKRRCGKRRRRQSRVRSQEIVFGSTSELAPITMGMRAKKSEDEVSWQSQFPLGKRKTHNAR